MVELFEKYTGALSNFMWGTPLLVLLLGGGTYFLLYSKLTPFRYFFHAWKVLTGIYDNKEEEGQISHFQALSTALASTVGMGNISGVAVAIATGGPGAIFWMWVSAVVGTATKFFTCSLAVMYRGLDDQGELQGGPMYVIVEGLGKNWRPVAVIFCLACMIGVLPIFQANQLTSAINEILIVPSGIEPSWKINLAIGLGITIIVSIVVIGGLQRIANVASRLVPGMVVLYLLMVLAILILNYDKILPSLNAIVQDAMTGDAVLGGALGALILTGVKRGTFSNEAGIGTAPMAHGAAKTNEPIREGLVGMLGPFIDTIVVCTLTALAIIITGVWKDTDASGIALTSMAFGKALPGVGDYLLTVCIAIFSMTTMFAFPYYGQKATAFVFGTRYQKYYNYFYISTIIVAVLVSLNVVINISDAFFAIMAFPTTISALILSPKVLQASKSYFSKF